MASYLRARARVRARCTVVAALAFVAAPGP